MFNIIIIIIIIIVIRELTRELIIFAKKKDIECKSTCNSILLFCYEFYSILPVITILMSHADTSSVISANARMLIAIGELFVA